MDNAKPWWKVTEPPKLSDMFEAQCWAVIGLVLKAFEGDPKCQEQRFKANLPDGASYNDWADSFSQAFPDLRIIHQFNYGSKTSTLANEDGLVTVDSDGDGKVNIYVVTRKQTHLDAVAAWFVQNTVKSPPKGRVHVLVNTRSGLEFKSIGTGGEDLVRENYDPKVLEGYDRVIHDLTDPHPSGRIAIFNGQPGSGKTYLIRGLLNDVPNVIFVIVPANLVGSLGQPGMIPSLILLHQTYDLPIVFLVEDADEVLAPRGSDNMSAVSSLLNIGDGILGKLLNIYVIATTNARNSELDEAIMRPGRLIASILVDALGHEQAQEVYRRLTGNTEGAPREASTLAEIYQMARDKGWVAPKAPKKVGFAQGVSDPGTPEQHLQNALDDDESDFLDELVRAPILPEDDE